MKKLLIIILLEISFLAFKTIADNIFDHGYYRLIDHHWHRLEHKIKGDWLKGYRNVVEIRMKGDGTYEARKYDKIFVQRFKDRLKEDNFQIYNWHKTKNGFFTMYRVEFACDDFIDKLTADPNFMGLEPEQIAQ